MDRFAFIGHPIDLNHFYTLTGRWSALIKRMPRQMLYSLLLKLPPLKYCEITNIRSLTGNMAWGFGIMSPLLPHQVAYLHEETAIKKVIQAVRLAERLGAKLAVLGGFTSIVGDEGAVVSKMVPIPVTSGNTYTACLAIEGIKRAASIMDLDLGEATLAIIGATGDIGSICTKVLSKRVKKINIAARNEKRLNEFSDLIRNYGTASIEVYKRTTDAVKEADIILTATSAVSVLINAEDLKPGAIVCDVAIPANIAKEIVNIRDDVLVFEGGLAKHPFSGDRGNKKFRMAMPPNSIYGCLAEGILLTLENRFENYSLGRGNITEEKINEMFNIAKKHGFGVADFFCGYKLFTDEDLRRIKDNASRKKEEIGVTAK